MKRKILSMIVTLVFVMMSLLHTSITVFAEETTVSEQSEEVDQKVKEINFIIDSVGNNPINIDAQLKDMVIKMIKSEDADLGEGLARLDKILKIVKLIKQYNDKNERKGGIIGFVQAYSDYSLAVTAASVDPMDDAALNKAINAGYNMSDAAMQAFADELSGSISGITSKVGILDGVRKLGQLAVLAEIVSEFQTEMDGINSSGSAEEIMDKLKTVHDKLHGITAWKVYLESNNIDIPDIPTSTPIPTVTPTATTTITPTATPTNSANDVIHFEDDILENKIRIIIGKKTGNLLRSDVEKVTKLDGLSYDLSSISGIQNLTNLTYLDLSNMYDGDISALANLTNLTTLKLSMNNITDISALQSLTNLTTLGLSNNQISDISVLANLKKLSSLQLTRNQISDISALQSLTNLTTLELSINNITDISALQSLTNLTTLGLKCNKITDILALRNLTNLISISLEDNNISDISALQNLANLTTLVIGQNNISDISALQNLANLTTLDLETNNISDIAVLKYLKDLEYLNLGSNFISVFNLQNLPKLKTLVIFYNQINTLNLQNLPKLEIIQLHYQGTYPFAGKGYGVNRIEELTLVNLQELTTWDPKYYYLLCCIKNVKVQNLPKLTYLNFSGNRVRDLSELKDLPNLTVLKLNNSGISDISALANQTIFNGLDELWLNDNEISDLSELKDLPNLTVLQLNRNKISDISALANLPNLNSLGLTDNKISDISLLKNFTNLDRLDLNSNPLNNSLTPNAVHKSELDFSMYNYNGEMIEYEVWVVEEPVKIAKGDIDGNGLFNAIDFANMRMFLIGSKTFTDQQLKAADVNSDGSVNAIDFAIMRKVILGIQVAFD